MICKFTYWLKSPSTDADRADDIARGLGMTPPHRRDPRSKRRAVGETNTTAKILLGVILKRFTDARVEFTQHEVVVESDSASWPERLDHSNIYSIESTS